MLVSYEGGDTVDFRESILMAHVRHTYRQDMHIRHIVDFRQSVCWLLIDTKALNPKPYTLYRVTYTSPSRECRHMLYAMQVLWQTSHNLCKCSCMNAYI